VPRLTACPARILARPVVPAALAVAAVMSAGACTTGSAGPATHQATRSATSPATRSATPPASSARVPRYSHIVMVIEENHSYEQIIGSPQAPYINSLARAGALFTDSHAITHPSEPNYMALTSGSTHGLSSDACPFGTSQASLGSELIAAGLSYADYSESMPSQGYHGCSSGEYARRHNPAANYTGLPAAANATFAAFPRHFTALPTVSLVVPNLQDDMHDGTIAQGDSWLRDHLNGYLTWARNHNSLLIVTWDENDFGPGNHIATIFAGAHVKPGRYGELVTHYRVLRTIEQAYGLKPLGSSADTAPVTDVFG
jgi:acid phosphatase